MPLTPVNRHEANGRGIFLLWKKKENDVNILLVHEISVVRKILTSYILSELSEANITTAKNTQEGIAQIETNSFEVVLCAREMAGTDGFGMHKRMASSALNRDAAFVMMSSNTNKKDLAAKGISHMLSLPCTSLQIKDLLYRVADPRRKRTSDRYVIPGVIVNMEAEGGAFTGKAINISKKGVLCHCDCPWPSPNFLNGARLSLRFPPHYGSAMAEDIMSTPMRIKVESWDDEGHPSGMKIVWFFRDVADSARATLEMILEKASREIQSIEDEAQQQLVMGKRKPSEL